MLSLHYRGQDLRRQRLSGAGVVKLRRGGSVWPVNGFIRSYKVEEMINWINNQLVLK